MHNRKRLYGRVNYQKRCSEPPELYEESYLGVVFVDGKRIDQVWFVDTAAGIVKTYDVMGDKRSRVGNCFTPSDFPGREVECPPGGIVSEVLRGDVELYGPELPPLT
jgi:hypothetical protein